MNALDRILAASGGVAGTVAPEADVPRGDTAMGVALVAWADRTGAHKAPSIIALRYALSHRFDVLDEVREVWATLPGSLEVRP